MIFSRTCENAIRATLYVAAQPDTRPVPVRDIARGLDIPFPSLAKIIQGLNRQGLIRSQKGPGGGVVLAPQAGKLTLLHVAELVEGRDLKQECVLGLPGCSEQGVHCPLHDRWQGIRGHVVKMLASRTIAQVATQLRSQKVALAPLVSGRRRATKGRGRAESRKESAHS